MDMIETLSSCDQIWFQEELNKMISKGYELIFADTLLDSCDNIKWTAILSKIN